MASTISATLIRSPHLEAWKELHAATRSIHRLTFNAWLVALVEASIESLTEEES